MTVVCHRGHARMAGRVTVWALALVGAASLASAWLFWREQELR
jgi:type VI protein secretion system component VasF